MKHTNPALHFPNPRLLAAIYFGLLSVVGTILTNAFLVGIGIDEAIPVFQSVLLGMIVASLTGAIFGEKIVHCKTPYKAKTFWLGFAMVMASLPVFTLGLVGFMKDAGSNLFSVAKFHQLVYFYLIVLAYSYLLYGIVLGIASGFAAMYLRGRLVYDILHTHEKHRVRRSKKHRGELVHHRVRTSHR